MSVENLWVPETPVKPSSSKSSSGEENQQKSDGSNLSFAGEEVQAGKVIACSDSVDFVTLDNGTNLVVDLGEVICVENGANCCSISASSEKTESGSINLRINEDIIPQVSQDSVSSKSIPHFIPMTPDNRTNVESKQVVQGQSCPAEDMIYEEGQKQECKTVNIRTDGNVHQQEICELDLDSSSAAVLTPFKDNHNSDIESNTVSVNVIETPQLKQRRRKHRPKVVIEGKQTPKSVTPKAATAKSKENSTGKRKYVRKNAVNKLPETPIELGAPEPVTPKVAGSNENSTVKRKRVRTPKVAGSNEDSTVKRKRVRTPKAAGSNEDSTVKRKRVRKNLVDRTSETPVEKLGVSTDMEMPKHTKKTCRRSIKFTHEGEQKETHEGEQKDESSSCKYSSIISEAQAQVLTTGEVQSHSTVQHWKQSEPVFDHRQARILNDPNPSMHQPPNDYKYLPESQASSLEIPIEYNPLQLKLQINFSKEQERRGKINSQNDAQLLSSSKDSILSTTAISTEKKQARGFKREFCHYIKEEGITSSHGNLMDEFYHTMNGDQFQMPPSEHLPYIYEKAKTVKMQHTATSSMYSNVTEQAYQNNSKENPCMPKATHWIPEPQFRHIIPRIPGESVYLQKPFEFMEASSTVEMKPRRWKARARAQTMGSWSHTAQSNIQATYSRRPPPVTTDLQRIENSHGHYPSLNTQVDMMQAMMAWKNHTENSFTWVSSNTDGAQLHPKPKPAVYNHYRTFQRLSEQELSANFLAEKMKVLDINRESKISLHVEQNAMVLYNMQNQGDNALIVYGRDGSMVPFERFLPVKRRKQHAKVDLDGETIKVWKLLMENSYSEGIDGSDEDRVKWWEEERRIFCGRADSFIARMHLIQGDRRFIHWKGSVLDSVIGVFLTQNVSDHLSSSAFMSLAAHFPLKSRSLHKSCCDDGTSFVVDEPEIIEWKAEDRVNWNEHSSDDPICKQSCMTVHEADKAEEKVLTSSESSGSNMAGFNSTHECQFLTSSYSSQKVGEWESQRSTTEINIAKEACPLGDGKVVDTVISPQISISSDHSLNSSFSSSIEDRQPCLTRNSGIDLSVNGSTSSVVIQNAETTLLKMDCKNVSGSDSSDDKSGDALSKLGKKDSNQRENNGTADHSSDIQLQKPLTSGVTEDESFELCREDTSFLYASSQRDGNDTNEQVVALHSASQTAVHNTLTTNVQATRHSSEFCNANQCDQDVIFQSPGGLIEDPQSVESQDSVSNHKMHQAPPNLSIDTLDVSGKTAESDSNKHDHSLNKKSNDTKADTQNSKGKRASKEKKADIDWDNLRKQAQANGRRERTKDTMDSLDWEAVRCADVDEIAYTIRERGMNNKLAERIKAFLNRLVNDHGSTDLEWLRDVSPDQAKEYLLSVRGLGLKSVECVRLLSLHQLAFPVDTNVGRIAVRLGWVPIRPLPESLQLHLLELYPIQESIQKYLWPRLCKLDQKTLYELHYQMITFGKVFCTKSKPNCNACPMRGECKHFASAFASARLALPAPEEKSLVDATSQKPINPAVVVDRRPLALPHSSKPTEQNQQLTHQFDMKSGVSSIEPIVEEPASPEPECPQVSVNDIEDTLYEGPDEIPIIKLNIEAFTKNLQNYMQENMELEEGTMSKALVALSPEAACIPMPKLKNISRLRTEHQVYELPDSHPLLEKLMLEQRDPDDPCFYLLAIWTPGETASSTELPHTRCSSSQENGEMCGENECFSCNSVREANSQVVRGTILIPCRTAMRGSFPLNGTYFQVNEVFADHESSLDPINVPRGWLWNLSRRTVYFGTSIPTIFKGLSTEEIQHCFWRGYVCVRGFERKTQAPRPLMARLHFPASKLTATRGKTGKPDDK